MRGFVIVKPGSGTLNYTYLCIGSRIVKGRLLPLKYMSMKEMGCNV